MRRRVKELLAVLSCAVLLAACTITQNQEYRVDLSISGAYMHVTEQYTTGIRGYVFYHLCGGNYVCTGNYLHDNVAVNGWGAAQWHTATHYYEDLGSNIFFSTNTCLVLHEDPFGGLNWQLGC